MQEETTFSKDFDFQIGSWRVNHRRLKERLVASTDWDAFDGMSNMRPVLGGNCNVEDNLLHLPAGSYRAIALRSFDPLTRTWAIWWLDARHPHALDVPVISAFEGGIGRFCAETTVDDGRTWETNRTMDFHRS